MGIQIKTNVRIKVNGKEYGSVDELPPEIQDAYRKQMGVKLGTPGTQGAITVNGKTYKSLAELPPDERMRYEEIMKVVNAGNPAGAPEKSGIRLQIAPGAADGFSPNEPQDSSSNRAFLFLAGAIAAIGLLYRLFAAR